MNRFTGIIMRGTILLLLSLSLTGGCVDALGIGSSCSAEMREVRQNEGGPPDETQRDEDRGDYSEVWYFDDTRRRYTFRWGVSYQDCEVQSGSFTRLPSPKS